MLKKISFTLAFTVIFSSLSFADEIIKDKNGNYFLMKDNGTFIKLPKPKPGNKYVIKKKLINKKKKSVFTQPKKKARRRTDTGFR
tara:strand:+ start:59 stop:313 length:255 start_codon:yes stop_codon:yes gene_type:complete